MSIQLTFHGAAQTTTGSMHRVDINGTSILLDCGLFQGHRKEAFERNRNFPFAPKSIDRVVISHAHIDHSGNLPSLVRRGFTGTILTTPATADLCDIMLRDSAYLQGKDVEYVNRRRQAQNKVPFEPLYTEADVDQTLSMIQSVPYGNPFELAPGTTATFHDAGHLLGSAVTLLQCTDGDKTIRLLFTGDLGRHNMPILNDPEQVRDVDVLITESTYGSRLHPPIADVTGRLKSFIEDIYHQHAKLIIPSFSVGRTQEIVYFLNHLYKQGRTPAVPIFVDSPLSTRATEVYRKHPECFDPETSDFLLNGHQPFHFHNLTYVTSTEDSMRLNERKGPAVIIASSGMCEGGRILHHLKHGLGNARNIVLFVGYQAANTLGRRIVEHESPVRIFGESYEVQARIHTINALSAHADRQELMDYITGMGRPVRQAFVIHGELSQSETLARAIRESGAGEVRIPAPGDTITL